MIQFFLKLLGIVKMDHYLGNLWNTAAHFHYFHTHRIIVYELSAQVNYESQRRKIII